MNNRPKIKPERKQKDVFIDYLSIAILVSLWAYLFSVFSGLPEEVAIHFNALGEPDRFAPKAGIFLVPGIGTLLFAGIKILSRYPHLFNYPVKITEENASRLYSIAVKMLTFINLAVVIIFTLISIQIVFKAQGSDFLASWIFPLLTVIVLVPTIFFTVRMYRKR